MRTRGLKMAGLAGCLLIVMVAARATMPPRVVAEDPAPQAGEKNASPRKDGMALAESRVALEGAAMKVADAQKKVAAAKLTSARSRVVEARAVEEVSRKQLRRFEELLESNAVPRAIADEHRAKWVATKTGRAVAEDMVSECEAGVAVEEARVGLARLKVADAELRLKQVNAGVKP